MLELVADENFNGRIVRGLRRRMPELDLLRIQDTRVAGAEDPDVLEWAAQEGRLVLTHDVSTMTAAAVDRVRGGKAMPGVAEVDPYMPIGQAIEEILLLALASTPEECEGQIFYLPL